jgi:hypothetical protein
VAVGAPAEGPGTPTAAEIIFQDGEKNQADLIYFNF